MHMIDLTGTTFGRWAVISRAANDQKGQARWLCRCECGAEKELKGIVLRRGLSKSCGCLKYEELVKRSTKHGHATNGISPTYHSWASMIARCTNPRKRRAADWIGRGITVCDRWQAFPAFLADMGEKPDGLSLDRIDNSLGYDPNNCQWATSQTQNRNKRSNRTLTYNGKTQIVAEWAEELGLGQALRTRLSIGWSVERALTQPLRKRTR